MKGAPKVLFWGFAVLLMLWPAATKGQGTISFSPSVLTSVRVCTDLNCSQGYPNLPTTASIVFGVFWSAIRAPLDLRSLQPVLPLGSSYGIPGLINVPLASAYPIPGTEPGQKVWLQVRAWSARFGTNWQSEQWLSQTDVREIVLGPTV